MFIATTPRGGASHTVLVTDIPGMQYGTLRMAARKVWKCVCGGGGRVQRSEPAPAHHGMALLSRVEMCRVAHPPSFNTFVIALQLLFPPPQWLGGTLLVFLPKRIRDKVLDSLESGTGEVGSRLDLNRALKAAVTSRWGGWRQGRAAVEGGRVWRLYHM